MYRASIQTTEEIAITTTNRDDETNGGLTRGYKRI